ncbi:TPA: DUF2635 domain-containing protein [Escherichia coli]|nr:DUF2635 domain-containing protein [Escherichia coli]
MFVKPVKGRSVPDPARGDLLPAEGRNVDENNYWLRREAAGDIRRVNKKVNTDGPIVIMAVCLNAPVLSRQESPS